MNVLNDNFFCYFHIHPSSLKWIYRGCMIRLSIASASRSLRLVGIRILKNPMAAALWISPSITFPGISYSVAIHYFYVEIMSHYWGRRLKSDKNDPAITILAALRISPTVLNWSFKEPFDYHIWCQRDDHLRPSCPGRSQWFWLAREAK